METPRNECSTTFTDCNPYPVCACGCGESFGPTYTGRNRFKRGHYRFIPDQHRIDEETGCWIWQGPVSRSGHGLARNDRGINEHAHRLYYEALVRPLADDELVHHTCANRLCCNPAHMEIMPKGEHQRRHVREQWQRQYADPDGHHIGVRKTADIIASVTCSASRQSAGGRDHAAITGTSGGTSHPFSAVTGNTPADPSPAPLVMGPRDGGGE